MALCLDGACRVLGEQGLGRAGAERATLAGHDAPQPLAKALRAPAVPSSSSSGFPAVCFSWLPWVALGLVACLPAARPLGPSVVGPPSSLPACPVVLPAACSPAGLSCRWLFGCAPSWGLCVCVCVRVSVCRCAGASVCRCVCVCVFVFLFLYSSPWARAQPG